MKKHFTIVIALIIIMFHYVSGYGQKIMKLDNELKANSSPMEAKRKGMSSVGKYEFGPYRIVSGKAGWTATTSNKKFLSFETKSESKKKSSFVFVANSKDTIQVNTSTNTKVSETEVADWSFLNQSKDNYIAIISPRADTAIWKMVIVFLSGEAVEGNYQAKGTLSDGVTNIQIREVKQWEDGKVPVMKVICGYVFYLDDKPIAAVQSSIDSFQKKFVWLHQNLDEKMKQVLAAASASLMVHTDDAMASMDN